MINLIFATLPLSNQDFLDLKELTQLSTQVVIGDVLTQRAEINDGQVSTYVTIVVSETLKGKSENIIDVKVPGGRVNEVDLTAPGTPKFINNTEVLLYLNGHSIVGIDDGMFIIENDRIWRNANNKTFTIPHILFPTLDILESSYYFESWPLEDAKWIAESYKNK